MRAAFAEAFLAAAQADPRVYMVVADLSPAGAMEEFRAAFPTRFINTGVAEQAMIGVCAGLAAEGKRPFAYTIAPFALFRPFEFVRDDLCYQNLPVTVVGMGAGLAYSSLGATHQAIEDVAVACALPNMTVLAPCDPAETKDAVAWCAREAAGPVYLRIGKSGEGCLTGAAGPFQFGVPRYLRRAAAADVCILGYGPILELGMRLAARLEATGEDVSVASVHTVKPLDVAAIERVLRSHGEVIVLEEMGPHGGLADRVKAIAWAARASCRIQTFSLRDAYLHCYGSRADALVAHGLDLNGVVGFLRQHREAA